MIDLYQKIIGRIFKRHYWYCAQYRYTVNGVTVLTFDQELGVRYQNLLNDRRILKKYHIPKIIESEPTIRRVLNNGKFDIYLKSYLGWW